MLDNMIVPGYFILVTYIASAMLVRISIWCAPKIGLVDIPRGGRTHEAPTPLMGGLSMMIALALIIGIHAAVVMYGRHFLPVDLQRMLPTPNSEAWTKILVIGIGAVAITVLGVIDDAKQTGVGFRLLAECTVAAMLVHFGVKPTLGHIPEPVVFILTVLWIVGIMNAFNLVDGIDGLAGSLALVASMVFLMFMIITGQENVAVLLAAISGAVLGFLRWNWHPAKTFMGSGGSLLLGYLLASIPLVSDFMQADSDSLSPVMLPVLVLSVPLYDTMSVIILRISHGRSPVRSDHNHLAHRLRRLGLSVPQTVAAMSLLGLATGLMSMLLLGASEMHALIILLSVGAMFCVFIILERVHLAHHDSERLVDIPGMIWVNLSTDKKDSGRGFHFTAKIVSAERIEITLTTESLPFFAEAFGCGRSVTVELSSKEAGCTLVMLASLRSIWRGNMEQSYIGLIPIFADKACKERAQNWIAKATYPGRQK
ncbi:MAG: undecaprenyl/decaprenyl-phosphate alpha-N-acetylglucosaminyl 1-phosphate transferase [Planctomycetes bacterium]|nr:undecaprenyl/decaprenyl-phosphate alpha-N-acetylglucosaminyl 1-phosphate transferase [Planctomycetota bacterium]